MERQTGYLIPASEANRDKFGKLLEKNGFAYGVGTSPTIVSTKTAEYLTVAARFHNDKFIGIIIPNKSPEETARTGRERERFKTLLDTL